jgi:hypothetical protein
MIGSDPIPDTDDPIPIQWSTGKSLLGTGLSRCFFEPSHDIHWSELFMWLAQFTIVSNNFCCGPTNEYVTILNYASS